MRDLYGELGVTRVLNAATTYTSLGGSTLPEEVVEAMAGASTSCVDMSELHVAAGRHLANLTRNDAGLVTSGCAAAIVLAVLACITEGQPERIARLPYGDIPRRRVVMHRAHRIPYDRAIELAGGRIVEVGNVLQTFDWELRAAIDDETACVFWVAGSHLPQTTLSLETTIAIAHECGVPVIVDAAAQLPPVSNLWDFTVTRGADVVVFSGGKALRGPQASGLMLGRADLIEAARLNAAPFQRLARPMKVGKEEIAGLLAAVERYLALDHKKIALQYREVVETWREQFATLVGVTVAIEDTNEAGQPVPRLVLNYASVDTAAQMVARLYSAPSRIAVVHQGSTLYLSPDCLAPGDEIEVARRFHETHTGLFDLTNNVRGVHVE